MKPECKALLVFLEQWTFKGFVFFYVWANGAANWEIAVVTSLRLDNMSANKTRT